jgi:hypothetical protein
MLAAAAAENGLGSPLGERDERHDSFQRTAADPGRRPPPDGLRAGRLARARYRATTALESAHTRRRLGLHLSLWRVVCMSTHA